MQIVREKTMKRWQKHTLGWIGALAVVACSWFLLLYWLDCTLCENTLLARAVSPDGKLSAVVFHRDAGATTRYSTQVSIQGASTSLTRRMGNALITDDHSDRANIRVKWTGPRSVLILRSASCRVIRKADKTRGVMIAHEVED